MSGKMDDIQAFPYGIHQNQPGMTLRDWFAGQELANVDPGANICGRPEDYARIADHCYRMADAMLAERSK